MMRERGGSIWKRTGITTRAALASVATALFLTIIKSYAVWQTDSAAVLGSLADSGLDLVAALVTLYGVRLAAIPPDQDHRFGHGKAEALAAMFQVILIVIAALAIGGKAIMRGIEGGPVAGAEYGIAVALIAIAVTLLLLAYQRRVVRSTGSVAIRADSAHYQSDLLLNMSVIAALVIEQYVGLTGADALFGMAIALWLLWSAWQASSSAIDQLMDREWPPERRQRFLEVAAQHPELRGIHDLRTRTSGTREFVQLHVWVDPTMSVLEAHRVMDQVEARLSREFPGVEILIHPDPTGHPPEGPAS